jgi:hypothetical protein
VTDDPTGDEQPIARGWATVELERAARDLGPLLADDAAFADAARTALLGGRCRTGRARPDDPAGAAWIVILEPDTEGQLAAFLARHGEGWAVTWFAPAPDGTPGESTTGGPPGPLGPERLAEPGPVAGPFRMRLTAATIER